MTEEQKKYWNLDIAGMNEVQMRAHKSLDGVFGIVEEKPVVSLEQIKKDWYNYYNSWNRNKKDTERVFPGFLKKRKRSLNALGIYSYKDFFGFEPGDK